MKFDVERGRVWTAFHEYLRASRAASAAGHTKEARDKVSASLDAYEASMDALVEAASQEQRARAEEAELGCEALSIGDPYERLAATIEAGKLALRERDAARRKLGELVEAIDATDASSTDARKWATAYRSLRIAVANARTTDGKS